MEQPSDKTSQDQAREALIAISYTSPEEEEYLTSSDLKPVNNTTNGAVKGNNTEDAEKLRAELISISYDESSSPSPSPEEEEYLTSSDLKPVNNTTNRSVKGNNTEDAEKLRAELISISYDESSSPSPSPDVAVSPNLPNGVCRG